MKLDLLVACKELLEFMGKSGTFYEFSIRIKVPLFKLLCFLVHIFFFKSISPNVLKFAWSHGLTPFQVFLNVKFLGSKAKKVALFPQIGRVKNFFSLTRRIIEYVSEYTFLISKAKRLSPESRLRIINLRPPEWRFFSSPAFFLTSN